MKRAVIVICAFITLSSIGFSCNLVGGNKQSSIKEDSLMGIANAPMIQFEKESVDFGTITEGDSVSHVFKFKNMGKSPLTITDVQVQCGCTVASKPEYPIGVGKEGQITVSFNSEGKLGANKKFVTIYSNANPPQSIIAFAVNVVSAKDQAKSDKQ